MTALLELRDVDAAYGPFRALFGVSLAIEEKKTLALLGPNGAGKTTVARVCSGLVPPTRGEVLFDGDDVSGLPTHELARRKVVHAPEGRSIFSTLTVEENLTLAFRQAGDGKVGDALDRAFELFPRLGERRTQLGATLSGGEQRMLALARVLVHPPRLLIVDELSLGLAPLVVAEVYEKLAELKELGTTLLIVEQHVHHALAIADDVVILRKGQVEFSGPKSQLGDEAERLAPDVGD